MTLNIKTEIEHFGFPFRRFMIGRRISLERSLDAKTPVTKETHTYNIVRSQSNHVYWLAGDKTLVFEKEMLDDDGKIQKSKPKSQKALMEVHFFQHNWFFIDTTTSMNESQRVCLTDLKTKKYNGKVGIRGSFAVTNKNDPERYMITLDNGEGMNIKPINLKEAPLSPQVLVHKSLENHKRVGKLHRFFATKVDKLEKNEAYNKKDILSVLEGVQTYGILKWNKNNGGADVFEGCDDSNCGALSPAFAGLLMGLSFGQTKAYKPIIAQMENIPRMSDAYKLVEKSLAFLYGRLEVAKFLISSFANFTDEHGLSHNQLPSPETSLHSLIKDLLLLEELDVEAWECYDETGSIWVSHENNPWTFAAPENPVEVVAIIAQLLSIPFENTTYGTREQRQEVVNNYLIYAYPFTPTIHSIDQTGGVSSLAAHAQSD